MDKTLEQLEDDMAKAEARYTEDLIELAKVGTDLAKGEDWATHMNAVADCWSAVDTMADAMAEAMVRITALKDIVLTLKEKDRD